MASSNTPVPDLQDISDRKIDLVYRHLPAGLLVNLSVASGIIVFLSKSDSILSLGIWWSAVALVAIVRFCFKKKRVNAFTNKL